MDTLEKPPVKLVWAVMAKNANGTSEIVRVVTDHHEADLAEKDNPGVFYKSGPVPIF